MKNITKSIAIIASVLLIIVFLVHPLSAQTAYQVRLEYFEDVEQGIHQKVKIFIDNVNESIPEPGGFSFLIEYNPSALSLATVDTGQMIIDCGWELFSYSYGNNALCGGSPCPSGTVRITAAADFFGNTLSCFLDGTGHLATLDFLVTDDRDYECEFVPINYVWYDCGDNTISPQSADSLFISRSVFDTTGIIDISDPNDGTPTIKGAQDIDCSIDSTGPYRMIDFYNGGLLLSCADSIITGINDEEPNLPQNFALHQNYPNPFNPTTTIGFDLARAGEYKIEIIDITGRKVAILNGHGHIGHNSIIWDGSRSSSGVYLYKLVTQEFVQSRKMLLLK